MCMVLNEMQIHYIFAGRMGGLKQQLNAKWRQQNAPAISLQKKKKITSGKFPSTPESTHLTETLRKYKHSKNVMLSSQLITCMYVP